LRSIEYEETPFGQGFLTRDGRTVVVATHDTVIAHTADLIVEMEDGRVVRESSPNRPRMAGAGSST
jgi:ABC-type transport system involved in cytochrome bd biosynthesis fused ATPase/permease subunit